MLCAQGQKIRDKAPDAVTDAAGVGIVPLIPSTDIVPLGSSIWTGYIRDVSPAANIVSGPCIVSTCCCFI